MPSKSHHQCRRIRQYLCDNKAESVCCPKLFGSLVDEDQDGKIISVYAVNNVTLGIRTKADNKWQESEAFFWSEGNCFPGRGKLIFFFCLQQKLIL